jgi:hypothetical protein
MLAFQVAFHLLPSAATTGAAKLPSLLLLLFVGFPRQPLLTGIYLKLTQPVICNSRSST